MVFNQDPQSKITASKSAHTTLRKKKKKLPGDRKVH